MSISISSLCFFSTKFPRSLCLRSTQVISADSVTTSGIVLFTELGPEYARVLGESEAKQENTKASQPERRSRVHHTSAFSIHNGHVNVEDSDKIHPERTAITRS